MEAIFDKAQAAAQLMLAHTQRVKDGAQIDADVVKTVPDPAISPLRKRIEAAVAAAGGDHQLAGLAVCLVLEDEIDLAGNGWFARDKPIMAAIKQYFNA